jgi:hypothetical protein
MKKLNYAAFALAISVAAAGLSLSTASAAGISPVTQGTSRVADQGQVEKVQYGRCGAWYRTCRARWGFGGRFRRCMALHGCP